MDDVLLYSGACPPLQSCDFESSDMCAYKNDATGGGFSWTREQASDDAPDKTLANSFGHFMVARSVAPHTKDRKARLLSPNYIATTTCVRFWYKLRGDVEFNVRTYSVSSYSTSTFFNATGDRGSEWSLGMATLNPSVSYQVSHF